MGICASSQFTADGGRLVNSRSTVKIVHLDGRLQELRHPVEAADVLSRNPNSFLCTAESMYVGSSAPHVPKDDELKLGQIYFVMPISQSQKPLSLQDLCSLAIKASAAIANRSNGQRVVPSKRSGNGGVCKVPNDRRIQI